MKIVNMRSGIVCSAVLLGAWTLTSCDESPKNSDVAPVSKPQSSAAKPSPTKDQKETAAPAKRKVESAAKPIEKKDSAKPAKPDSSVTELELEGITLSAPSTWTREQVTPGPMAPVASFRVTAGEGSDPFRVRITYYPMMKGMDDQNIERWVGQVKQPDGSPSTKENAKMEVIEEGSIRLKIVDISGTINTRMRGGGEGVASQRMISAIVDHPSGPHFVKAVGSLAAMEKAGDDVYAFIKSAKSR